jgi:hypothetical protein
MCQSRRYLSPARMLFGVANLSCAGSVSMFQSLSGAVLMALSCFLVAFPFVSAAQAASLQSEGTAAGLQCVVSGINNSGVGVGTCTPGNATGPSVAWVAPTLGTEIPLPPLTSGQSCRALDIDNAGVITGVCLDADNVAFAVTWNAGAPSSPPVFLDPLPGFLGLAADVRTTPTADNQAGAVAGESISAAGNLTAVLWPAGSGSPIAVSSPGDNCIAADVNTPASGAPSVALNCPNAAGTVTAKIVTSGLLGYAASPLPIPSGATYCSVTEINNAQQAVGTCHFPAPDTPTTAYWVNCASSPTLITLAGSPRNGGEFINNLGHVVFDYQDASGQVNSGFWNPTTGSVTLIPPLSGGVQAVAAGLSDNDTVLVNSEDSAENVESATWTPSASTVAVGFYGGGQVSALGAISQSGAFAGGGAEDSSQNHDAVVTSLP